MSIKSRHSRNKHGDAVLTITVVGDFDILRFATNMLDDQCEISELGHKALRWQRRRIGLMPWREWVRAMYGKRHPMLPEYAATIRADRARRAQGGVA